MAKDIIDEDTKVSQVANEYGISRPIVSRWIAEYKCYKNKAFACRGIRLPDKAKLHALEQENKRLEEENEILKKFEAFVRQKK